MLSYGIEIPFKQDLTAADLIADLSLLDWDGLSFMDKFVHTEDLMLGSDDEAALQGLSEIIEDPVLLDTLLNEEKRTQPSSLPTSRQYDVLLSQQHGQYVANNQAQQPILQQQAQQMILQQQPLQPEQQQPQQHQDQQQQQQQQFLFENQLLQQQQHISLQQQHYLKTESPQDTPSNQLNLPPLQHISSGSECQQPRTICTSYSSLHQAVNQPSINQPSTLTFETYSTLSSTNQTTQNFNSSPPFPLHSTTAPINIQRPSFHPMAGLNSTIHSMSTQSSPQHRTFEDPSPVSSRTMPDMEELWDYFSYCHNQVSLKNSAGLPPLPSRSVQSTSAGAGEKNPRYRSHGSLSDIHPLSSEYEPAGKKLRQSSLDERRSEVANTAEFEDVKSVDVMEGCSRSVPEAPGGALSKEDLLCSVCGDNAVCLHYGARTCEGCKGFFKRTVQKRAKYVCLEEGRCPVDKRRRNRCQFCRFQKCLSVGMQREVVRMNTLKGRRGRLPSKGVPFITTTKNISSELVKIHMQKEHNYHNLCNSNKNTNNSITSKSSSESRDNKKNNFNNDNCDEDRRRIENSSELDIIADFYEWIGASLESFKDWASRLQGFQSLLEGDKNLLFAAAFLELFTLQALRSMEGNDGEIQFGRSTLRRSESPQVFVEWLEGMHSFVGPLKRLCLDPPSAAHLEALLLFADRYGLKESEKVSEMQELLCGSLQEHISNTYDSSPSCRSPVLSHILGKISHFRNLKEASHHLLTSLQSILPLPSTLTTFLRDS